MRLQLFIPCLLMTLSAPISAWAQQAGAIKNSNESGAAEKEKTIKEAHEAFLHGREAYKARNYASALTLFQKSQRLYSRPGTLYNLAICEQELGMIASAWTHFNELIPQLPKGDDRLPDTTSRIITLEPRVPRIRIELGKGAPANTAVSLDGRTLAAESFGVDLFLNPGVHKITATVYGRRQRSYEVDLAEGARLTQRVEPAGEPSPVGIMPPSHETSRPSTEVVHRGGNAGTRVAGFVVGGIGIVGLGVGAVTGILAIAKKNEVDNICPATACTAQGVAIEDTARVLALTSTVTFIVGGAGVGLGTFLVVWNGARSKKSITAVIGASTIPRGIGISAVGSF